MDNLNWNLLNSFLSVANMGSLSKAAVHLGTTQPTIGRHIEQLEVDLNVRLFDRTQQGYKITELGMQLAEQAAHMRQHADKIALIATGKSEQVAGTVRITGSEMVAINHLPLVIRRIRQEYPEIQFEIVSNDESDNLLQREADIAIRMYQPKQDDLIVCKVNELEMGIYVAKSYPKLEQALAIGVDEIEKIFDLDFIGYDKELRIIQGIKEMGLKYKGKDINRNNFNVRSDTHEVIWHSLLAGLGISFQPVSNAKNYPELIRILPEMSFGRLPIWITAHREVETSRRIRLVYEVLCDYFAKI